MAKESITPEDKLLRLIEAPTKVRAALFKKGPILKKADLQHFWQGFKVKKDILGLDALTKALAVLAVILTFVLVGQIFASRQDFGKKDWGEFSVIHRSAQIKTVQLLSLTDYLGELSQMNMFSGVSEVTAQATDTKVQEDIAAQLKNLKLVGIIWSNNPQAMIENSAENRTSLVNVGDQLDKIKIKNIYQDRVVLGVDNQEWELR
ncbi:MAG: type II secretion system protein N [Candidatus Omnitrophota bacterium]|nr:type II secretion system protein N [Candidatus Omnitrophota bacterium]